MTEGTDRVIGICPRCGGTIEVGQKVYIIGENEVMSNGETHLIKNMEKVCEECYPRMEVRWPDRAEHDEGAEEKAIDVVMADKAPATG